MEFCKRFWYFEVPKNSLNFDLKIEIQKFFKSACETACFFFSLQNIALSKNRKRRSETNRRGILPLLTDTL